MTTRNKKNSDNAKMKTGTKVLIGVGAVGAAFAICYKWGPCRSFFANAGSSADSSTVTPADNASASGPRMPSPTDFALVVRSPINERTAAIKRAAIQTRKVSASGNGTLVVSLSDPTYKVKYDEAEWKDSPAKGKLKDYLGKIDDKISSKKALKFLDAYGGALGHRPTLKVYRIDSWRTPAQQQPAGRTKVAEYTLTTSEALNKKNFKKSFSLPPGDYFVIIPDLPREETSKREFPTGMYYFRSDGPHAFTLSQMKKYWEADKIWYSHTRTRMYVSEGGGYSRPMAVSAGGVESVSVRQRFHIGMKDKYYFKDPGSIQLGVYGKAWNYSHN